MVAAKKRYSLGSAFGVYPTYVCLTVEFLALSALHGGLIRVCDVARVSGRNKSRISYLSKVARFTKFIFPFGIFLSANEVAEYCAHQRPAGRPSTKLSRQLKKASVSVQENMRGRGAGGNSISTEKSPEVLGKQPVLTNARKQKNKT